MTVTAAQAGTAASSFGRGGSSPYARALRRGRGTLHLVTDGPGQGTVQARFDVGAWFRVTAGERSLVAELRGPVLDIGCGPGRLVATARALGLDAVGIDVDPEAVRLTRKGGGEAIHCSVFDAAASLRASGRPGEGWGSALLFDGNIGIGGEPMSLLHRIRDLTAPGGRAWVETAAQPWTNRRFTARLRDAWGRESRDFPWASVGWEVLPALADACGWDTLATRALEGRVFCQLRRR
ncbi:class I SAM-dependent methyltransferase [Sinomonas mesophila]|uniref:class I SAM-dependent methyltransferase n=1 Tax=Sinomonas mesophila TaxID=1531955 RepID=UPI0009840DF4|nr:class I SAM-dependent methyltransferase [Sinomonas mesophila]